MHELQSRNQIRENLSSQTEGIRLNLGGRGTYIPGFLTVDLSNEHDVDIRSDVSDLSDFQDNTISELYCSQILEHFPHVKTESVLGEWHRVLTPKGKITIGVPDFQRAVDIYLKHGLTPWVNNFLYGDQEYPLAFHYTAFTFASLAGALSKVGFRGIKRVNTMPYGILDCSTLISSSDNKNVSLNVEAYK